MSITRGKMIVYLADCPFYWLNADGMQEVSAPPDKIAIDPWATPSPPKPVEKPEPAVKIAVIPGEQW